MIDCWRRLCRQHLPSVSCHQLQRHRSPNLLRGWPDELDTLQDTLTWSDSSFDSFRRDFKTLLDWRIGPQRITGFANVMRIHDWQFDIARPSFSFSYCARDAGRDDERTELRETPKASMGVGNGQGVSPPILLGVCMERRKFPQCGSGGAPAENDFQGSWWPENRSGEMTRNHIIVQPRKKL